MLTAALQPSDLRAWTGLRPPRAPHLRLDLGSIGRCPKQPDLTIVLFDDSGSVTAPGGSDPIGNRYEEARLALRRLSHCMCGNCLAAARHFDTPCGDVEAGPLAKRWFQRRLEVGLGFPTGAAGQSLIGPSLRAAETIAADHPDHTPRLVAFTDWELFDPPGYLERLEAFPGEVTAVGLGSAPPASIESEHVQLLTIEATDPPGTFAKALFGALVAGRPNAQPH